MSEEGSTGNDDFRRDLEEMLRKMMSEFGGAGGPMGFMIPGLSGDPQSISNIFAAMQSAEANGEPTKIDWKVALETAKKSASSKNDPEKAEIVGEAFKTAALWVSEVTSIASLTGTPQAISQAKWVSLSIDSWSQLAEPIAQSISKLLSKTINEQLPEELQSIMPAAGAMLSQVAGSVFALQLGQIVGKLSREVLSGGDIGIPVIKPGPYDSGVLVPENIMSFASGLEQPVSEVTMFLAVREVTHALLFKQAKWIRQYVQSLAAEYAAGLDIDIDHFTALADDVDLQNPEAIQELMASGSLIPPKTEEQEQIHERLSTIIALTEGWVDVVSAKASARLPGSEALREMMRRRRATASPSSQAFASLLGLELHPRKHREAANMWLQVEKELGQEARDSLWAHPDLMPTAEEIENPAALIKRIKDSNDSSNGGDDFDRELRKLLGE